MKVVEVAGQHEVVGPPAPQIESLLAPSGRLDRRGARGLAARVRRRRGARVQRTGRPGVRARHARRPPIQTEGPLPLRDLENGQGRAARSGDVRRVLRLRIFYLIYFLFLFF